MKENLKAVGVKHWITKGKKWAEEERHRKNHLQAALVMGRKEAGDTHPGAPLPSCLKQNPASFVWGFFLALAL